MSEISAAQGASQGYCAEQVRRFDRDRYLCAQFAPAGRRPALHALHAFNLEIARTREQVSETMIGLVRLQWWRDAIAGLYAGSPPRHAVVEALADAVERHGLSRHHFDRLIDAREFDLDDEPPADLDGLVDYAEATSAHLAVLVLEALGAGGAAEAGRHVGIGWALTGLTRAIPFHARARRLYLPRDLLDAAGVDAESVFSLKPNPALAGPVAAVVAEARRHLAAARELPVSRAAVPALLPARLADAYLGRVERAGFDPFDARVAAPLAFPVARLAGAALFGKF